MPSPLLQLRIPQDLADWLEAKYPSRGEVAAYVRELLTAEQMKEAAAPLVPSITWTEDAREILEGGFTPNEFDAHKAKPKARRKKVTVGDLESDEPIDLMVALKASVDAKESVKDSLTTSGEASTSRKAPRSRQRANTPASVARSKSESPSLPVRCNRGACTGTINPVKGRCVRCNQTPLKESQ